MLQLARRRHRTLTLARALGVGFAVLQITLYATLPYPDGVQEAAYASVGVFAVYAGLVEVARRRLATTRDARRLALWSVVGDTSFVSLLIGLYAFDPVSALFVVLLLPAVEGAVFFGFAGAMWTWLAVSVLYGLREALGPVWGNPFELDSLTFRVGVLGIISLIVGRLVRDLDLQREATSAALAEARRAEDWRARLVAVLAHDVRSPMASVASALDLLSQHRDELDEQQFDRVVDGARRQSARALLLARDLLDLARVDDGELRLAIVPLEVGQLFDELLALFPPSVEVVVDDGGLTVPADPARIEQVLYNLLENATKYGRGPIELSARSVPGAVELSVRDHGPGLPADVRPFDRFGGSGEGSVGLGTWTARLLAEAHGGAVRYEDAAPGARFVVTLPAGPATAAPSPSVQDAPERVR